MDLSAITNLYMQNVNLEIEYNSYDNKTEYGLLLNACHNAIVDNCTIQSIVYGTNNIAKTIVAVDGATNCNVRMSAIVTIDTNGSNVVYHGADHDADNLHFQNCYFIGTTNVYVVGGTDAEDCYGNVLHPSLSILGASARQCKARLIGNDIETINAYLPTISAQNFTTADTALSNALISSSVQKSGDIMSGDLGMGGNNITNLASGVNANDAVNVSQVQMMTNVVLQDSIAYTDLATNGCLTSAGAIEVAGAQGVWYEPDASGSNGYFSQTIPGLTFTTDVRFVENVFMTNGVNLISYNTKEITADYSVLPTDVILFCNGTMTNTLPDVTIYKEREFMFKNIGTGIVYLYSADGIDGVTYQTLSTQYKYIKVIAEGSEWYIIGEN